MNNIQNIGKYFILLKQVLTQPERFRVYTKRVANEWETIGLNSMGIVGILSVFMGAVIALQTASNMDSPLLPKYTIGYITRSSTILEFSPTIISLILAGKVGSNIASEIGTMRVTEQIDALDIMGINSASYLILPKLVAAVTILPFLIIFSMALSIMGGYYAVTLSNLCSHEEFVYGIRAFFEPSNITYALVKTMCFAFIIVSVSAFYGYYTKGGALDVGKSSTQGVVWSTITILIANFILTQLILL
ncbi:phospholipid/cholesterol/gamma-HCH transport system permease protein [Lishizhenia tianjinensis]|uniref:Phospholipid/cholesterol/gamma-HCH transport system permease protein n=1 Tax=Lishizhenia tianjinensis TaxID=477690 RepID=A0A1I6ZYS7_9FLAO|nr:ABC transporter permease [Lishizhenia tianjinensis]SFT67815.1 phospholipid/cholesterol/gamma-HCH transport system permease protein [Lishizhenia tianjinensis]